MFFLVVDAGFDRQTENLASVADEQFPAGQVALQELFGVLSNR